MSECVFLHVFRSTSGAANPNGWPPILLKRCARPSMLSPTQRTSMRRLRPSVQPNSGKPLREPGEPTLCSSQSIVFIAHHQHAQASHAVGLLRARRERPICRATADE